MPFYSRGLEGVKQRPSQAVKNIDKPVRVYRVLMKPEHAGKVIGEGGKRPKRWTLKALGTVVVLAVLAAGLAWNFYWRSPRIEKSPKEKTALPLPEKPSIAVLPFVNMSGDPNQEFFSDGITDNIITALAKVPNLFVIARNSTFAYKGKPVKIQQVAEAERAVEIAPNFADAYSLLAQVLNYSGRPGEAIIQNERAFRLNPVGRPSYYYLHAAHTHALTARYEDGVKVSREGISLYPDNALLHARLAMLYAALGRGEEARDSVQDVLRLDPTFSAQRYAASMSYKDPAMTAQALEWMQKAGLPD